MNKKSRELVRDNDMDIERDRLKTGSAKWSKKWTIRQENMNNKSRELVRGNDMKIE
jgi:hypothetical protein